MYYSGSFGDFAFYGGGLLMLTVVKSMKTLDFWKTVSTDASPKRTLSLVCLEFRLSSKSKLNSSKLFFELHSTDCRVFAEQPLFWLNGKSFANQSPTSL